MKFPIFIILLGSAVCQIFPIEDDPEILTPMKLRKQLVSNLDNLDYQKAEELLDVMKLNPIHYTSEDLNKLARILGNRPEMIQVFCRFLKENPITDRQMMVEHYVKYLTDNFTPDSFIPLYYLGREFPLLAKNSFDSAMKNDKGISPPLDLYEAMIAEDRLLSRQMINLPNTRKFFSDLSTVSEASPMGLVRQGLWRIGLGKALGMDATIEALADLQSMLVDYPPAFSQFYALVSDNFAEIRIKSAKWPMAIVFQKAADLTMDLERPIQLCRTEGGSSVVLPQDILAEGTKFDIDTKHELVMSLIVWLTFREYDSMPYMHLDSRWTPAQLFNLQVAAYCRQFDDLHPAISIAEAGN